MSNLTDFIGSKVVTERGRIVPVKQVDSMRVNYSPAYNRMYNPDNSGGYVAAAGEAAAWSYKNYDDTVVWSLLPTDIAGTTIAGVCWYSPTSVLFLTTNESNTVYLREVTVATGVVEGVSIDLALTCTTGSTYEYYNSIQHRDGGGFYLHYSDALTIVDSSFNIVSTISKPADTGGFQIDDSLYIRLAINVDITTNPSKDQNNICSVDGTVLTPLYSLSEILGISQGYITTTNIYQYAFTYYTGVTRLAYMGVVVDTKDFRRGLLDICKKLGVQ